jgi:hypothetical protein
MEFATTVECVRFLGQWSSSFKEQGTIVAQDQRIEGKYMIIVKIMVMVVMQHSLRRLTFSRKSKLLEGDESGSGWMHTREVGCAPRAMDD